MNAHILLVNADATGSESLKNLVLPGIGRFTIADSQRVTASDCGSNFFVTSDSIGMPRARVVAELLCEMNSDVSGHYVDLGASLLPHSLQADPGLEVAALAGAYLCFCIL
jgi:amyloid beta precursor protein binding protein 1